MFGLVRKKTAYEDVAERLYKTCMEHSRDSKLYTDFGVPDSFDGRFEALLAHVFIVIHRVVAHEGYEELSQALFDITFADMDQSLRRIGIGDMGVPKHMKKMMEAFNTRMHHYEDAVKEGTLAAALVSNLYGAVEKPDMAQVKGFEGYMLSKIKDVEGQSVSDIAAGIIEF